MLYLRRQALAPMSPERKEEGFHLNTSDGKEGNSFPPSADGPFLPITPLEQALRQKLAKAKRRALALERNLSAVIERGLNGRAIEEYVSVISHLEKQLIEAEEELVKKDLQLLDLQRSRAGQKDAPEETIDLHRENAVLQERLRRIQSEIESERNRSIRLARTVARLRRAQPLGEEDAAELTGRIRELEKNNDDLKAQAEKAGDRVISLHRAIADITRHFKEYVAFAEEAKGISAQREAEICELTTGIARLRQEADGKASPGELAARDGELARLRGAVEFAEDEREDLSQNLLRAQQDVAAARAEVLEYKANLSRSAAPAPPDIAERFARELKRAIIERDELAAKLADARSSEQEKERITGALENKLREATQRLSEYEKLAHHVEGDMKLKAPSPVAMGLDSAAPSVVEFSRIKAERDELVNEHAEAETKLRELKLELERVTNGKTVREKEFTELRSTLAASHGEVLEKTQTLEGLRSELNASRARYDTLRYELDHTRHLIQGAGTKKQQVLMELIKKVEQEADLKLRLRLAEEDTRKSHEQAEKLARKVRLLGKLIDKRSLAKEISQRKQTTA